MQVQWNKSITFKLFLLMSSVTLISVAGISWYNLRKFKKILEDQLSEKTISVTENAHQTVTNLTGLWQGQVVQTLTRIPHLRKNQINSELANLIAANPDFVALHFIQRLENGKVVAAPIAFTNKKQSINFRDKNPDAVKVQMRRANISWVEAFANKPTKAAYLFSSASEIGLPIINLAVPAITGKRGVNWGILSVWQEPITGLLPHAKATRSFITDKNGKVLISAQENLIERETNLKSNLIVKLATRGTSPTGSRKFETSRGKVRLGAFAWSDDYQIATVAIRDPSAALQAINREVANVALIAVIFLLCVILISYHAARQITSNLKKLTQATQYIARGNFKRRIRLQTSDETALLGSSINNMARQIKMLLTSKVEQARQEKELETAKVVQQTLFPDDEISKKDLTISGCYFPASECGGDWWGHFTTDDEFEFLCIADATGHGAAAALVTAIAYSSCMTLSRVLRTADQHHEAPQMLLTHFNQILWDAGRGTTTMTFFASFINKKTGVMTYANAGHNHPYLLPATAQDERLTGANKKKSRPFRTLISHGSPLGMTPDSTYSSKTINVKPGDKFFLYTDGLIECTNHSGEMWGKKRLQTYLTDNHRQDVTTMKQKAVESAFKFFGTRPMDDDITVVVAEISSSWAPHA